MKDDLSTTLPSLTVSDRPLSAVETPVLVIGLFEKARDLTPGVKALDEAVGGKIRAVVESGDFSGKTDETALLYLDAAGGPRRICLAGLGKRETVRPRASKVGGGRRRQAPQGTRGRHDRACA